MQKSTKRGLTAIVIGGIIAIIRWAGHMAADAQEDWLKQSN